MALPYHPYSSIRRFVSSSIRPYFPQLRPFSPVGPSKKGMATPGYATIEEMQGNWYVCEEFVEANMVRKHLVSYTVITVYFRIIYLKGHQGIQSRNRKKMYIFGIILFFFPTYRFGNKKCFFESIKIW